MNKSFVDRIFPHTSTPLLPTHDRQGRERSSPSTPFPLVSGSPTIPSRSRDGLSVASQKPQPRVLSASIVHPTDPLLPVDRAAKALHRTVQSLLDAQSDGLSAGLGAGSRDDVSSTGSLTPTPSISTPPRSAARIKATPVRQPNTKKISLRSARKGLSKSMQAFVLLKDEELTVLDAQSRGRQTALLKVRDFEDRHAGLRKQIDMIKVKNPSNTAQELQKEARNLDVEIKELEDRLLELKTKQRHLLDRASQIENSVSSKLSSYNFSLALVDAEIKKFLERPPVSSSLLLSRDPGMGQSMHDLKVERRTLEMAREEWTNEQKVLDMKKVEVDEERRALEEGSIMWRETLNQINGFEKELRAATKSLSRPQISSPSIAQPAREMGNSLDPSPTRHMQGLLPKLDSTINFLESNLRHAEQNHWNLLICCIGAELEAFREGRALLRQTFGYAPLDGASNTIDRDEDEDPDGPDEELLQYGGDANGGVLHSPGAASNQSLEDTMKAFGDPRPGPAEHKGKSVVRNGTGSGTQDRGKGFGFGPAGTDTRSDHESEDDDPGPDFFLSHS